MIKSANTFIRIAVLALITNSAVGQSGLLYHWSFDTIVNSTFEEHVDGIYSGTSYDCSTVAGPVGNALYFDGNNDYASIPGDSLVPPPALANLHEGSISLWFRADNIPLSFGMRPIFYYGSNSICNFFDASNEGMIIEIGHSPIHNGSKRLYFTSWADGCGLPTFCTDSWNPIELGQWYHYVVVVGSNYNTGYLNGELMYDRNYNFGSDTTTEFFADVFVHEILRLGKGHWDGQIMHFEGAIDELKIFDHALSQVEVDQEFAEGNLNVGMEDRLNDVEFNVYPNPATEDLYLQTNLAMSQSDVKVIIHDLLGNEISVHNFESKEQYLDISSLEQGAYMISLYLDGVLLKVEKIIKL